VPVAKAHTEAGISAIEQHDMALLSSISFLFSIPTFPPMTKWISAMTDAVVSSRWVDPLKYGDGVAQRCGRSTPAIFTSNHESDHFLRNPPGERISRVYLQLYERLSLQRCWARLLFGSRVLLHHNIQSPGYGLSSRLNDT